jgi:hypothetical protein
LVHFLCVGDDCRSVSSSAVSVVGASADQEAIPPLDDDPLVSSRKTHGPELLVELCAVYLTVEVGVVAAGEDGENGKEEEEACRLGYRLKDTFFGGLHRHIP